MANNKHADGTRMGLPAPVLPMRPTACSSCHNAAGMDGIRELVDAGWRFVEEKGRTRLLCPRCLRARADFGEPDHA